MFKKIEGESFVKGHEFEIINVKKKLDFAWIVVSSLEQ